MSMQTDRVTPDDPVGLSEAEAKEVHHLFVKSFLIFTAVAVVAHVLAWAWRPWLPGPNGYSSLMDGVHVAITHFA